MKTLVRVLLGLVAVLVVAGVIVYAVGASLPVNHVASVTATIAAPPEKVYARIVDVAAAPSWRHEVKSVKVLPPAAGRDHWVEDLGHNMTMDFVAISTVPLVLPPQPVVPDEHKLLASRAVLLSDPQYGGTWLYELYETRSNEGAPQTILRITETGYIHPPLYRFMMAHVFGMTHSLDQYVSDMKAAVAEG